MHASALVILFILSSMGALNTASTVSAKDTTPPVVTINFAGNLGDTGGPYWQPPGETTPLTGAFANGYYTNNSRQREQWMYVNLTVTDPESTVTHVWLQWLNATGTSKVWTNYTYAFAHGSENYWTMNTSTQGIATQAGSNYSFNIVANSSGGSCKPVQWTKTGIGGSSPRRYVQLHCTPENISYQPLYISKAHWVPYMDSCKKDRLLHDQGLNSGPNDTGYVQSTLPTNTAEFVNCGSFISLWYNDNKCIEPLHLKNIYYHLWYSSRYYTFEFGWNHTREQDVYKYINSTGFITDPGISRLYLPHAPQFVDPHFTLLSRLLKVSPVDFTDNNIYELTLGMNGTYSPAVANNRSYTSFCILNVPSNATLNSTDWTSRGGAEGDYDGDGLSDWTELYVTYTNPFLADTDNDRRTDHTEYLAGSDPNDYTSYPSGAPIITINYAGNLGERGGPYYQPPGITIRQDTITPQQFQNGYYTNNSYLPYDWIYINATILDAEGVENVWLQVLRNTTWTNYTYPFTHRTGEYWDINTSGLLSIPHNTTFSFDIVVNDTAGNSGRQPWKKTDVIGWPHEVRRYVHLNCTQENISYKPLYFYQDNRPYLSVPYGEDTLNKDQANDGGNYDTGYLRNVLPTDVMQERWCGAFVDMYFDNNTAIFPTNISTIYWHVWWSSTTDSATFQYDKNRGGASGIANLSRGFNEKAALDTTQFIYTDGFPTDDTYYLMHRLYTLSRGLYCTPNDIYEFLVQQVSSVPSMINNRTHLSYIILNIPPNQTLNTTGPGGGPRDSDGDGLTDWTELYRTFTSPFVSDTDADGKSDGSEMKQGTDPNDYFNIYLRGLTIAFAGNPGDSGGPYYIPPTEEVPLAAEGYYTNDSYQSEPWITINTSIVTYSSPKVSIHDVWLNWCSNSTWTNYTYALTKHGNYWEINTSGIIPVTSKMRYTFDIVANATNGETRKVGWNKTYISGNHGRRYIHLGCSPQNITYQPFYFYQSNTSPNAKPDRLHHDQGESSLKYNTTPGFLLPILPTKSESVVYSERSAAYWFDWSVCPAPFTLNNIYYHFWYSIDDASKQPQINSVGWDKSRTLSTEFPTNINFIVSPINSRSNFKGKTYGESKNSSFHLDAGTTLSTKDTEFTDNNIYEFETYFIGDKGDDVTILCNRSHLSFVLLNVPTNEVLNKSGPKGNPSTQTTTD